MKHVLLVPAVLVFFTTLVPTATTASPMRAVILHEKFGPSDRALLGESVDGAGDVNGDGHADFIAGAPGVEYLSALLCGSGFVFSGADGRILFQWDGLNPGDAFGRVVAGVGDVTGDGKPDFLVSAYSGTRVYSGATGDLAYRQTLISADCADGGLDVDGDGRADILVGKVTAVGTRAGQAILYSGATREVIYQIDGSAGVDELVGASVALLGDVDGDSRADFAVGRSNYPGGVGTRVYAGATGQVLWERFPDRVAAVGDVDADGRGDFATATDESVYVFSGATGQVLLQRPGDTARGPLGDADGDGHDDVLVYEEPRVLVYSGADGAVLVEIPAVPRWASVAAAGDVDADGVPDIIIGDSGASPAGTDRVGVVRVYALKRGTREIAIDIRPGSCDNPFNPRTQGVLPVAILGGSDFSVADVDPASIRLEGVPPLRVSTFAKDIATPGEPDPAGCGCPLDKGDHFPDRTAFFGAQALLAAIGSVPAGEHRALRLTGTLLDGTSFEGTDCVWSVGGRPKTEPQSPDGELAGAPPGARVWPSPLRQGLSLSFAVEVPAGGAHVTAAIYSAIGRRVATPVDAFLEAGTHFLQWEGRDDGGAVVPRGVYFVRVSVGAGFSWTKALLVE